jgi:hypothetical protein
MESYIYTVAKNPEWLKRKPYNQTITVYRIKRNIPVLVGSEDINTASYRGDRATAMRIISRETGKKMADGYRLKTPINLMEV